MNGRTGLRVAIAVAIAGLLGLNAPDAAAQQVGTIQGTVVEDATLRPLAGVQVMISGTTLGTLTNDQGRFLIPNVPAGEQTVQARLLGYSSASQTINVQAGQSGTVSLTLSEQAVQLEGVVITALGVQRERSQLGTAQQQISSDDLNNTRAPSVVNQIQGKVSGVQISGSGTPGGSNNIVIRGMSSIAGNNQPLFVIDGIPVSNRGRGGGLGSGIDYGNVMNDLNPEDVETLTVLKGPNAAALYGSRAANGVIVITTKKGSSVREGIRTELTTSYTAERPSMLPDFQNQYGQGASGDFSMLADQSWGPELDGRPICQFNSPRVNGECQPTPWVANPNNVHDFFETGHTVTTTLAVSGGTDRANARLSVGVDNNDGYVPNNTFQRYTAALNGSLQVTDRLNTTGTVQYIQNEGQNRPGTGYNTSILQQFFWFGRQVDMGALRDYGRGGEANDGPGHREFNWNYNYHNNPFWIQHENPITDSRDRVLLSGTASYEFLDGVVASLRSGSDIYNFSVRRHSAPGNLDYTDPAYAGGFGFIDDYSNEHNSELLVTADRYLRDNLSVNALVGGGIRRDYYETSSRTTRGLTVPGIYNVSNAAITPTLNQEVQERHVNSVFGSLSFTWNDWLTLEGTGRNDWSSTLPAGDNSYFYPSVNVAAVLTEAIPGLRSDMLSFLKLRGSIAEVGNDASPYQLQTTYNGLAQQFAGQSQFTLANSLANAQLRPEITRSTEVGLEMEVFNGRAFLDATFYDQSTRNQIFSVPVSATSGFSSRAINAGLVTNRGFEAIMGVTPVSLDNGFRWTSTFNFARNRGRTEELYPGTDNFLVGQGLWREIRLESRVGQPTGALYGTKFSRAEDGQLLTRNGLPFTDGTYHYLGTIQPDWTGGWDNQFHYGPVSFNVLFDIRQGGNIASYTNLVGQYSGVLASTLEGRELDWDDPGILVPGIDDATGQPNSTRVLAEQYFQGATLGIGEPFVYDASYVKLREMRLGFEVPQRWTAPLRTESINIAVTGRNLLTWKDIPNVDPEFAYSSGNFQGFEYAIPATPRSIGLSVRVRP